jgi:hypothetical protein
MAPTVLLASLLLVFTHKPTGRMGGGGH